MRRYWPVLLAASSFFIVDACVGDDPVSTGDGNGSSSGDGGGSTSSGGPSSSSGGTSSSGGANEDGGGDTNVEPQCGYPGEDCCASPALACKAGTVCGTSNNKCMISELVAVGEYEEIQAGPSFTAHISSAFYDGKDWTSGPDVFSEAALSSYSATDLISTAPGNHFVTLFKSATGKMFNYSSGQWRKCEPGQSCVGPSATPPALWSVARISNDNWIGATNAIYRCVAGSGCSNQNAGLESTTWGTGKLVGTATQDIWYSANTRAFHFNGTTWTIHDNLKARTIFEIGKSDVWVGDTTLQHWNGTAWSTEFAIDGTPAPGIITSISGSSSKDVWAVGYNGSASGHPAFAAHWDGISWTMLGGKNLPADAAEAPFVYAPSPLEAYAAMDSGVYKWNGTQWTKMTFPIIDAGAGEQPRWKYVTGPAVPRPVP
jgi:hypothetical protein